jgi:hypothetical protein
MILVPLIFLQKTGNQFIQQIRVVALLIFKHIKWRQFKSSLRRIIFKVTSNSNVTLGKPHHWIPLFINLQDGRMQYHRSGWNLVDFNELKTKINVGLPLRFHPEAPWNISELENPWVFIQLAWIWWNESGCRNLDGNGIYIVWDTKIGLTKKFKTTFMESICWKYIQFIDSK